MPMPQTIAAAHLKCFVNGHLLGWTTGVAWDIDYGERPLYEIDSNVPAELVPGQHRVGGIVSLLRGRFTGGLEGMGIVAFAERVLRQKYSTIELVDRATDMVVLRVEDCHVSKQSWRTDAKGVLTGSFAFTGRRTRNESAQ